MMATSAAAADYFRAAPRTRPPAGGLRGGVNSPGSPRTPQLGRSISSQFGSPGNYRTEQEDVVVYELGARHFSAGYAGESRPRCILPFTPDAGRRVGDFRQYDTEYANHVRKSKLESDWGAGYELYRTDLRDLDLGLIEDKLDRTLRTAQIDYLQLDVKPRKAVFTISSMLPTPLLEVALKVLFSHFTQPPSIIVLTHPIMCCVSAGLRNALVVDVGWEETVVTAVGEYKEVTQSRSVRAGKLLTREVGHLIEANLQMQSTSGRAEKHITFDEAEDFTQRMAWCRRRGQSTDDSKKSSDIQLPIPASTPPAYLSMSLGKLSEPAERTFFAAGSTIGDHDDHDLPLPLLAYRVLLSLPTDLRAICVSRLVITGGVSRVPGLKRRLLQEVEHIIQTRGWDPVWSYGSAKSRHDAALKDRLANLTLRPKTPVETSATLQLSPMKMPLQEAIPHADRVHDDIKDPITLKAEREATKGRTEPVKAVVRGVETLGAWAGASLIASMRIKGVHEVDRDDFLRNGLKNGVTDI